MWNIGICTDFSDLEKLKELKEIGYDFFEFGFASIGTANPEQVDAAVEYVKTLGIPVVSMNGLLPGDFRLTGPDANHDEVTEFVENTLKKAVRFGTKNFVLGSGKARNIPEGYSHEDAAKQLKSLFSDKLLPVFEKYDCYLSIEELRREECNIYNSCREVMQTVREINHPNLKLLVDFYHASLGGDTMEELASYKGYISHVHIASPKNARCVPLPGDGEDYAGFFAALKDAGYQAGNISLEGNYNDNFYDTAAKSLAYLRTFA